MTRALLAVAHPDDELLFATHLMLTYPTWEWTWVVACNGRSKKLAMSARLMKAQGVNVKEVRLLGLSDDSIIPAHGWFEDVCAGLLDTVGTDIAFTHNRYGDYGHPQHIAVNQATRWMYENTWEFLPHRAVSPVGLPWAGETTRTVLFEDQDVKPGIALSAYGSHIVEALRRDRPSLIEWAFSGVEAFTSSGGSWPEFS